MLSSGGIGIPAVLTLLALAAFYKAYLLWGQGR